MMLANNELRVILATIHVALTQVSPLITFETELETIRLAQRACVQAGIAQPRIAVAGLNPHAGEDGRFGQEEIQVIAPAIRQARTEGLDASGPWPGDTVFMRARQGEFDRSEEHTSELQSLMRISYAVFCLKKKKTQNTH